MNVVMILNTFLIIQKQKRIDIIKVIQKYVSDFNHSEIGKNLDQKM